jgi:hypothetical protein
VANIGVIGLGIMKRAMACNPMKAGHTQLVYDIVPASRDAPVADGAGRAESAKDAAARSESVITMLPDGPAVEGAVLGPGGVLAGAHDTASIVCNYGVAQFACAVRDFVAAETRIGNGDWMDDVILHDGPVVKDGYITLPEKPGLGIELNPDVVKAHLAQGESYWG